MPTTDCGFNNPYRLAILGPTLTVEIGFDANFRAGTGMRPELQSGPVPALVDTGASESCIDSELASALNLPVFDRHEIFGVGGIYEVNSYVAQIYIPALQFTIVGPFDGVRTASGGQRHYALIGRTFLMHFNMAYEGRTGSVIITND